MLIFRLQRKIERVTFSMVVYNGQFEACYLYNRFVIILTKSKRVIELRVATDDAFDSVAYVYFFLRISPKLRRHMEKSSASYFIRCTIFSRGGRRYYAKQQS